MEPNPVSRKKSQNMRNFLGKSDQNASLPGLGTIGNVPDEIQPPNLLA
jgi:hypothetical protein